MTIHRPWPRLAEGSHVVRLTPEDAGWSWTGLQVLNLAPGVPVIVETGASECFVLPLSGSVAVEVAGEDKFDLTGRSSVFAGASDFAYAGRDSQLVLTSDVDAEVALPAARCVSRLEPRYGAVTDVPVEQRGAGLALRHVRNFGVPGVWEHAEKLVACEVITPPGNWSSYPPHKHDRDALPEESLLEETYYHRLSPPTGFALQRVYTDDRSLDETLAASNGDVVLVPKGYHPVGAPHGYELYYLNVMAGPKRVWKFHNDPDHAWLMNR